MRPVLGVEPETCQRSEQANDRADNARTCQGLAKLGWYAHTVQVCPQQNRAISTLAIGGAPVASAGISRQRSGLSCPGGFLLSIPDRLPRDIATPSATPIAIPGPMPKAKLPKATPKPAPMATPSAMPTPRYRCLPFFEFPDTQSPQRARQARLKSKHNSAAKPVDSSLHETKSPLDRAAGLCVLLLSLSPARDGRAS